MAKNEAGAVSLKSKNENPPDTKTKSRCPCDSFLQCCCRIPYGKNVWCNPSRRRKALKIIAYNGKGPAKFTAGLNEEFKSKLQNGGSYQNKFYKTIKYLNKSPEVVLYFPKLSMAEFKKEMILSETETSNAAYYNDFQRSIILRANMAKNNLQKLTEDNVDGNGVLTENALEIYGKGKLDNKWNIDHIKIRSKGGCNRFCNAALLGSTKNTSKNDGGNGCPCVLAIKDGGEGGTFLFTKFRKKKGYKRYRLDNCQTFTDDKAAKEKGKAEDVPEHPLGTIDQYKQLCGLDDPTKFSPRKIKDATNEANKICKAGS